MPEDLASGDPASGDPASGDPVPEDPAFVRTLVGFARELRGAGLSVGSGDVLTFCAAMSPLDPTDLLDLYWGGRTTLVTRHDQIPVYDRVFRRYFLSGGEDEPTPDKPFSVKSRAEAQATLEVPRNEPGEERREEQETRLGLVASDAATLRTKSFAACTPEELAAVRRIIKTIALRPPRRRTRRTLSSPAGRRPSSLFSKACGRVVRPSSIAGKSAGRWRPCTWPARISP